MSDITNETEQIYAIDDPKRDAVHIFPSSFHTGNKNEQKCIKKTSDHLDSEHKLIKMQESIFEFAGGLSWLNESSEILPSPLFSQLQNNSKTDSGAKYDLSLWGKLSFLSRRIRYVSLRYLVDLFSEIEAGAREIRSPDVWMRSTTEVKPISELIYNSRDIHEYDGNLREWRCFLGRLILRKKWGRLRRIQSVMFNMNVSKIKAKLNHGIEEAVVTNKSYDEPLYLREYQNAMLDYLLPSACPADIQDFISWVRPIIDLNIRHTAAAAAGFKNLFSTSVYTGADQYDTDNALIPNKMQSASFLEKCRILLKRDTNNPPKTVKDGAKEPVVREFWGIDSNKHFRTIDVILNRGNWILTALLFFDNGKERKFILSQWYSKSCKFIQSSGALKMTSASEAINLFNYNKINCTLLDIGDDKIMVFSDSGIINIISGKDLSILERLEAVNMLSDVLLSRFYNICWTGVETNYELTRSEMIDALNNMNMLTLNACIHVDEGGRESELGVLFLNFRGHLVVKYANHRVVGVKFFEFEVELLYADRSIFITKRRDREALNFQYHDHVISLHDEEPTDMTNMPSIAYNCSSKLLDISILNYRKVPHNLSAIGGYSNPDAHVFRTVLLITKDCLKLLHISFFDSLIETKTMEYCGPKHLARKNNSAVAWSFDGDERVAVALGSNMINLWHVSWRKPHLIVSFDCTARPPSKLDILHAAANSVPIEIWEEALRVIEDEQLDLRENEDEPTMSYMSLERESVSFDFEDTDVTATELINNNDSSLSREDSEALQYVYSSVLDLYHSYINAMNRLNNPEDEFPDDLAAMSSTHNTPDVLDIVAEDASVSKWTAFTNTKKAANKEVEDGGANVRKRNQAKIMNQIRRINYDKYETDSALIIYLVSMVEEVDLLTTMLESLFPPSEIIHLLSKNESMSVPEIEVEKISEDFFKAYDNTKFNFMRAHTLVGIPGWMAGEKSPISNRNYPPYDYYKSDSLEGKSNLQRKQVVEDVYLDLKMLRVRYRGIANSLPDTQVWVFD